MGTFYFFRSGVSTNVFLDKTASRNLAEYMNMYFLGLIVPLLSFALQIWPRLIKRYFGVDTWRWLLFANYVRKYKALPTESPKQFIATSVFGYPPVVILFLSIFP